MDEPHLQAVGRLAQAELRPPLIRDQTRHTPRYPPSDAPATRQQELARLPVARGITPIGLSVHDPDGGMQMKARHRLLKPALDGISHRQPPFRQAPGAPMHRLPSQTTITIMGGGDVITGTHPRAHPHIQWPRPPGDAKAAPDLAGIGTVDLHRAVRRRTALRQPFRPAAIARGTTVDDHPLAEQRQLKRQGIGMGMAGQIVRANGSDIQDSHRRTGRQADIAGSA